MTTAWVFLPPSQSGEPYTVGFYDPRGNWQAESDHDTADEAAKRVHYLNGGITESLITPGPTPEESFRSHFQQKTLEMLCYSQEGNPFQQILAEVQQGRLMPLTDNLNRLLADVYNVAVNDWDWDRFLTDLNYTQQQLGLAHQRMRTFIHSHSTEFAKRIIFTTNEQAASSKGKS